jgi:chromosome segregation ATPase
MRTDLATTQKARSTLQAQLDELTASISALQTQNKASTTQITLLSRQKTDLERKLRDRDEEVREKGRLAEQAQNEMMALGLQLNMAEQQSKKLKTENEELVARWMKRMGEEAEKVNRDSRWE